MKNKAFSFTSHVFWRCKFHSSPIPFCSTSESHPLLCMNILQYIFLYVLHIPLQVLKWFDIIFTGIFAIEVLVKVFSYFTFQIPSTHYQITMFIALTSVNISLRPDRIYRLSLPRMCIVSSDTIVMIIELFMK